MEFPEEQTCCGQMHLNSGYADEGAALARRLAGVFRGYEAVVTPSASCAGMMREQLGDDAPPVYELSEFLVDVLGVDDVGAYYPHRVTYHPTCHSLRALRLGQRPLRLLSRCTRHRARRSCPDALECCGFGGTFAVKNADVSTAMLTDKVRNVLDTRAEVLCAVDSSCLMHIGGGLSRGRTGVRTVHLAEILASTEDEPWP